MKTNAPEPILPRRDPHGHKGTFGTVAVIGGCAGGTRTSMRMLGGPVLAATAALRAGAGKVILCLPEPLVHHGLSMLPEAVGLAFDVASDGVPDPDAAHRCVARAVELVGEGVIVIGPGLGPPCEGTQRLIHAALSQRGCAVVIDADGLNALATLETQPAVAAQTILTPHVGEARRLASRFLESDCELDSHHNRSECARALADLFRCVCVLKSHRTVIASESGTTEPDITPTPLLSTAGSGDVLAGMLGGLLAQHRSEMQPAEIAAAAVIAHSHAAHAWAKSYEHTTPTGGMLASDLLGEIPAAIEAMRPSRAAD